MKETMYSGVEDGKRRLIWTRGNEMVVARDDGTRGIEYARNQRFSDHFSLPLNLDRFTDLTVVWERG